MFLTPLDCLLSFIACGIQGEEVADGAPCFCPESNEV